MTVVRLHAVSSYAVPSIGIRDGSEEEEGERAEVEQRIVVDLLVVEEKEEKQYSGGRGQLIVRVAVETVCRCSRSKIWCHFLRSGCVHVEMGACVQQNLVKSLH